MFSTTEQIIDTGFHHLLNVNDELDEFLHDFEPHTDVASDNLASFFWYARDIAFPRSLKVFSADDGLVVVKARRFASQFPFERVRIDSLSTLYCLLTFI